MFPGYAFLQLHANIELKPIESTRGVIKIVRFGNEYPLIKNEIIQSIQKIEKDSLKDPMKQSFAIGEKIILNHGPLKHHQATIANEISDSRVEILYFLLSRAHLIQVDTKNISKI